MSISFKETEIMRGIEAVILTLFDREIKVVEVYPKGLKIEVEPSILARSFPLSSRGGEIVVYKSGDNRWVVSLTVALLGEKPRSGLASIIVLINDWNSVFSTIAGLIKAYDELVKQELSLRDLTKKMDYINKIIKKFRSPEEVYQVTSLKQGKGINKEIKKSIVKKGFKFFMGG